MGIVGYDKTMDIAVNFFKNDDIKDALRGGVYMISVELNGKKETLYIGESFSMLIRCAVHLYKLKNSPEYFGFTSDTINRTDITLIVEILAPEDDKKTREDKELEYIDTHKPITQSGIKDNMRSKEEKIAALEAFLNKAELPFST